MSLLRRFWKLTLFIIFVAILVATKYILFDYPISSGKRVGNLTKISKKGRVLKTWEGTLDEGFGEQLTSYFSVRDSKIAQELFEHEGRKVVIYYNQHILGFPRDTAYDVTSWKPFDESANAASSVSSEKEQSLLSKLLLCSFLGTLYQNQDLYTQVKDFIKENNPYLYKAYSRCNEEL